ncbi:hypothetical protein EIB86_24065 [Vibrio parahaemolyticus]|nr:hypothetical protein [Vibrio parahaemolyticus]
MSLADLNPRAMVFLSVQVREPNQVIWLRQDSLLVQFFLGSKLFECWGSVVHTLIGRYVDFKASYLPRCSCNFDRARSILSIESFAHSL